MFESSTLIRLNIAHYQALLANCEMPANARQNIATLLADAQNALHVAGAAEEDERRRRLANDNALI